MIALKKRKFEFSYNYALLIILAACVLFISSQNPVFLKSGYLLNVVVKNSVEIGLMAFAATFVIITGGIDLSCGTAMILCAVTGGITAMQINSAAGLLVTLCMGVICGLLNGVTIAIVKVPPMVTTLSTMFLYMGIARGITKGDSVYTFDASTFLGNAVIFRVPVQIWIGIIMAVLFCVLLHNSSYGRRIYAVGLNENAARYAGINTPGAVICAYTLCGLMAGLAALIWLGRFNAVKYDAGAVMHLRVITVVVLGGTSIAGGIGDMRGTILATLILATLNSGLTVLNIPVNTQTVVQGTVLLLSLIVFELLKRKMPAKKRAERMF
ncbi:MAG: ABC transporter permease [Treponema sp.]|jgi:ribose transport system permease protein/rhamnose transport system permease protein|nr:ABC transporter permease [Treponema sp.]